MTDATRASDPTSDLGVKAATPLDARDSEFVPRNSYSEIYWPWPHDFDGFEEFVKKSREESANCRNAPPWW